MSERDDVRGRAAGVLLGLAAGDRNGGPIRMALQLAESLRDCGGVNIQDIGSRYLAWWRAGGFDTGPTAAQVFERVAAGVPFNAAAAQIDRQLGGMTAGCNPAHRIAPLSMSAAVDDLKLEEAAIAEARLTHQHPLAGEVSAVIVRLCRELIRGASWPEAIAVARQGRSALIVRALDGAGPEGLNRGGFAPEVLRAAVFFLSSSDSLAVALDRSIEFAGGANYCPVLVGSIGGARWGRRQIADILLGHATSLRPRLSDVADELAAGWPVA